MLSVLALMGETIKGTKQRKRYVTLGCGAVIEVGVGGRLFCFAFSTLVHYFCFLKSKYIYCICNKSFSTDIGI